MKIQIMCKWITISLLLTSPFIFSQEYVFTDFLEDDKIRGWTSHKTVNSGESADRWSVTDGVLHGKTPVTPVGQWMVSDTLYKDFILQFEFRQISGNSGMNFRSFFGSEDVEGPQMDMGDKFTGRIYDVIVKDAKFTGEWMSDDHQEMAGSYIKEWNTVEMKVKGKEVKVMFNGHLVTDYIMNNYSKEGFLAIQMHSRQNMEIYVRKLRLSPWREIVSIQLPANKLSNKHPGVSIAPITKNWRVQFYTGNTRFNLKGQYQPVFNLNTTP